MPRHVVVVGAARSGTKMVRDALAVATGAGTVPYDIGYVWRYGNESHPDDALTPAMLSAPAASFIRRFVNRYADGTPLTVIEKTVGNTLRVPFVAQVFSDVTFVHLVRDGVDVIESTRRQWTAPADVRYLAAKARHFPLRFVPRYGARYVRSLLRRRTTDRHVGSWGPRYPGIDRDLQEQDLLVVCARQWRESVRRAIDDLARLDVPHLTVRYEDFVTAPSDVLVRVAGHTGLSVDPDRLRSAASMISVDRRGVGRVSLSDTELSVLESEVGDTLAALGYDRPTRPVPLDGLA